MERFLVQVFSDLSVIPILLSDLVDSGGSRDIVVRRWTESIIACVPKLDHVYADVPGEFSSTEHWMADDVYGMLTRVGVLDDEGDIVAYEAAENHRELYRYIGDGYKYNGHNVIHLLGDVVDAVVSADSIEATIAKGLFPAEFLLMLNMLDRDMSPSANRIEEQILLLRAEAISQIDDDGFLVATPALIRTVCSDYIAWNVLDGVGDVDALMTAN